MEQLYQNYIHCNQIVSTDTRSISRDCLFIALKGPRFNANQYAEEAIQKGARYAVIDEAKYSIEGKTILVDDCLKSLQNLAHFHRNKFNIPVLGITGSNGKTTSKELISAALNKKYNTLCTVGNLNNHIGVPLTLLKLNNKHQIAVIEMGASKPGDIKELVEIASPTHGLITNVGTAHIEGFGSFEGVLSSKKELYDYIDTNEGILFCNGDDQILTEILPKKNKCLFYGEKNGDLTGSILDSDPYISISWHYNKHQSPQVNTHLIGNYNLLNILSAISIANYFDVPENDINDAIKNYQPTNNRSQLIITTKNKIIADCYNANPTSTLEALKSFKKLENKKKLIILGDMLELGDLSLTEHQKIIDFLKDNDLNGFLIGNEFNKTNTSLRSFLNVNALIDYLKINNTYEDYMILVKGSRGIELEKLIAANIL